MFSSSFLVALLLVLSVSSNPVLVNKSPVTLTVSRRTNFTSVHNLLRHDQNRAKFLKTKGAAVASRNSLHHDAVISELIENQVVTYIASVGVGIPPQNFSLLIDTGSSNTWVGASTPYKRTNTSIQTSNKVSVTYGSGSFSGNEFIDTVTLAPGLVIPAQSIGVASKADGFVGVDGIMGIGPPGLTIGTLSPGTNTLIPTLTDNLFLNHIITGHEIGISFNPTTINNNVNGELTWALIHAISPLTTTSPANEFWGINQSVRYGASTSILSTTAGIVDTGTTLILLATDGFTRYKGATKATADPNTGLLKVTTANFNALQSLFFMAAGNTYELIPNAQIWPRALNSDIGGNAGDIYLIVADLGTNSGEGLDFINGFAFLERFYSVFDTTGKRVGFASTPFTKSIVN